MQLTSEQIEKLYLFTRQHFVEWYDLQTELVDHLANAIEAQLEITPSRTFDEALKIEFKKFGVFGFMDVVEKRQAALNKKYAKIVWSQFKNFFKLPQIIGTFSAVGILFLILKVSLYSEFIFTGLSVILLTMFIVGITISSRKNKKINEQTGKKWMFKEVIFGYGSIAGFINIPVQALFHFNTQISGNLYLIFASLFLVLLFLIEYVLLVKIPKKAEQYLKETYPEYEFSN